MVLYSTSLIGCVNCYMAFYSSGLYCIEIITTCIMREERMKYKTGPNYT